MRSLPPFEKLLIDGSGYIATTGEVVKYGPDYAKRAGFGTAQTPMEHLMRRHVVKEPYEAVPFISEKPSQPTPHRTRKPRELIPGMCRACFMVGRLTKHHIHPRELVKKGPVMRICRGCHDIIHQLPNKALMEMDAQEQIIFIQIRRGIVKLQKPEQPEDYSI